MEEAAEAELTLKSLLELLKCDKEGNFPDPRAEGFFNNKHFKAERGVGK